MNNFLEVISVSADFITTISLVWAIIWSLYSRKRTLIGLKVNEFLVSLLRIAFIFILGALFFHLWKTLYVFVSVLFNGSISSNNFFWDENNAITYLLSYLISAIITIVLFWLTITIIWTSSFEHLIDFINICVPQKVRIKKTVNNKLTIIEAKYGKDNNIIDVTEKLNQMVIDNKLSIIATNDLAGDPKVGIPKELKIIYKINEFEVKHLTIKENESITIEIPK